MSESPGQHDHRHVSPYSTGEKIRRACWAMVQGSLFKWSPRPMRRWRAFLLNCFGARIHPSCHIVRTARVECPWNLRMGANSCLGDSAHAYCLGMVTIGARVTVSQNAHLCAGSHDYNDPDMPLLRPTITIGDDAWIAADAFVGPGVVVGDGTILAARGVAVKDLDPWTIYGGNPARSIRPRQKPA